MEITPRDRTPRDKTARATAYKAYLQTPKWRHIRDRKLRSVRWRCERCGKNHSLEVHHRTYERLGAELDADLEALCGDCHRVHHVSQEQNSLTIYFRVITDVVQWRLCHDEHFDSFADLTADVKDRCADLGIPYDSDRLARAMALMGEDRLGSQRRRRVRMAVGPNPEEFLTHAEAVGWLRQFGVFTSLGRAMAPAPYARLADRGKLWPPTDYDPRFDD